MNGKSENDYQTSVRHDGWLKFLVNQARGLVPTPRGIGISAQNFFIQAVGAYATTILQRNKSYESVKAFYVQRFGPVTDFDPSIIGGESIGQAEEEDSILEAVEES